MSHLWLRHEYKPNERRAPITPEQVGQLVQRGHRVTVEASKRRVFHDAQYENQGAEIVGSGSWHGAPREAYILGIKEVLEDAICAENFALRHRHIYFAHVFKGQRWTAETMRRFTIGRGTLLDLEYLVDETGKRVAAFSYSAGFAGAIAAMHIWLEKMAGNERPHSLPDRYLSRKQFIDELGAKLTRISEIPTVLVIGANGRSGRGAIDFYQTLGITPVKWGRSDTEKKGPYARLLDYHIVCNCVYLTESVSPFLTADLLADHEACNLSVVADISNDLSYNPIFGIATSTTFSDPTVRIGNVDVIEIENLPVLTPLDSSLEYAEQFFPHLVALLDTDSQPHPIWERAALKYFEHHDIPQVAMECGRELGTLYAAQLDNFTTAAIRTYLRDIIAKNPLRPTERLFFADYLIAGASECLDPAQQKTFNFMLSKIRLDEVYDSPAMQQHHALLKAIYRFTNSPSFLNITSLNARDAFFEMCDCLTDLINEETAADDKYLSSRGAFVCLIGPEGSYPAVRTYLEEIERSITVGA